MLCAIEFYSLLDRVLQFARSSFMLCAIEFYSLRDRVLRFARSSFTFSVTHIYHGGGGGACMVKVKVHGDAVRKGILYLTSGVTKRMLFSSCVSANFSSLCLQFRHCNFAVLAWW